MNDPKGQTPDTRTSATSSAGLAGASDTRDSKAPGEPTLGGGSRAGWLFTASCIALVTSAFSFQMRNDISGDLATNFSLTFKLVGDILGAAFLGMAVAMLIFAPLCDFLGLGRILGLAWLCHLLGILGTVFAHEIGAAPAVKSALSAILTNVPGSSLQSFLGVEAANSPFWVLWLGTFLVGSGNGLVEIAINPLAATLYPRDKTKYLNILHAWWPGGLIISGLLAFLVVGKEPWHGIPAWQVKISLLLVPLLLYGVMIVGRRFPTTERVAANVPTGQMFLQVFRPLFLVFAFCMLLTASMELAPNNWQEAVLQRTANMSGTLVLVYTSAIMFFLRFFAGPLAHAISPVGMLFFSSLLTGLGLYALSFADNALLAILSATVFGIGIAFVWPTMLGVTAERFPKGGALLLGLMGCFGNLAISQTLPQMGAIYDSYSASQLPDKYDNMVFTTERGEKLKLVRDDFKTFLPPVVTEKLYPAGSKVLNPDALKYISETRSSLKAKKELTPEEKRQLEELNQLQDDLKEPETYGARWAFRWVAVLPAVLVIVFGLVAAIDWLRGGYKKLVTDQHLGEAPGEPLAGVLKKEDYSPR